MQAAKDMIMVTTTIIRPVAMTIHTKKTAVARISTVTLTADMTTNMTTAVAAAVMRQNKRTLVVDTNINMTTNIPMEKAAAVMTMTTGMRTITLAAAATTMRTRMKGTHTAF